MGSPWALCSIPTLALAPLPAPFWSRFSSRYLCSQLSAPCVWETPQDQLQQQQRCHQGMAAQKNGLGGVSRAVHKRRFECQNLSREKQGHCRYTWQGTSHSPRASLLKKAAPVRGVGEQSTENGSMQQVGGLMGTLRGYKRPESTVRTAEEPSPLLPSPRGMAEGLLQTPLQALPLQGRAGL